jgi:hypothetical protein
MALFMLVNVVKMYDNLFFFFFFFKQSLQVYTAFNLGAGGRWVDSKKNEMVFADCSRKVLSYILRIPIVAFYVSEDRFCH